MSERQSAYLCLVNVVIVGLCKSSGEEDNSAEEKFAVHDEKIDKLLR